MPATRTYLEENQDWKATLDALPRLDLRKPEDAEWFASSYPRDATAVAQKAAPSRSDFETLRVPGRYNAEERKYVAEAFRRVLSRRRRRYIDPGFTVRAKTLDDLLKRQVETGEEQPFDDAQMKELARRQKSLITQLSPDEEKRFKAETNWSDDPREFYDARGAWKAGLWPTPGEHGDSRFKLPGHPRTYVDGIDTIAGQPQKDALAEPPQDELARKAAEYMDSLRQRRSTEAEEEYDSALGRGELHLGRDVLGALGMMVRPFWAPIGASLNLGATSAKQIKGAVQGEPIRSEGEYLEESLSNAWKGALGQKGVTDILPELKVPVPKKGMPYSGWYFRTAAEVWNNTGPEIIAAFAIGQWNKLAAARKAFPDKLAAQIETKMVANATERLDKVNRLRDLGVMTAEQAQTARPLALQSSWLDAVRQTAKSNGLSGSKMSKLLTKVFGEGPYRIELPVGGAGGGQAPLVASRSFVPTGQGRRMLDLLAASRRGAMDLTPSGEQKPPSPALPAAAGAKAVGDVLEGGGIRWDRRGLGSVPDQQGAEVRRPSIRELDIEQAASGGDSSTVANRHFAAGAISDMGIVVTDPKGAPVDILKALADEKISLNGIWDLTRNHATTITEAVKLLRQSGYGVTSAPKQPLGPAGKAAAKIVSGEVSGEVTPFAAPPAKAAGAKAVEVLFHGSPSAHLTEIKPSHGDYGPAVYLTPDENLARDNYSRGRRNVAAYILGDTDAEAPVGTVYRTTVNLTNPLVIETDKQYGDLLEAHGDSNKALADWARKQGYDAIVNHADNEVAVFTDKPIPAEAVEPPSEAQAPPDWVTAPTEAEPTPKLLTEKEMTALVYREVESELAEQYYAHPATPLLDSSMPIFIGEGAGPGLKSLLRTEFWLKKIIKLRSPMFGEIGQGWDEALDEIRYVYPEYADRVRGPEDLVQLMVEAQKLKPTRKNVLANMGDRVRRALAEQEQPFELPSGREPGEDLREPPKLPTATQEARVLQHIAETEDMAVLRKYAESERHPISVFEAATKRMLRLQRGFDITQAQKRTLDERWAASEATKEETDALKLRLSLETPSTPKPPPPPQEPPKSTLGTPDDPITPLYDKEFFPKTVIQRAGFPAEEASRRFGESGVQIGIALTNAEMTGRQLAGGWMKALKLAEKPFLRMGIFSRKEFDDVTKLLDPEKFGVLENPTVAQQRVAAAARAIFSDIMDHASEMDIQITLADGSQEPIAEHIVENYLRRRLTDKATDALRLKGSAYRERAIEHLMSTGQAETQDDAERLLGAMLDYQKGGPRHGSLEHVRVADLPAYMYEQRFRVLIAESIEGAGHYLGRVQEFGQDGSKLKPQVDAIRARYGDRAAQEVYENIQRAMGRGEEVWWAGVPNKAVPASANIGLSSPRSSMRNVLFGLASDITTFGVKATIQGIIARAQHPVESYYRAIESGAVESGAAYYRQAGISHWLPSRFMADGERWIIRPTSMMIAEVAANDAAAVLQGELPETAVYMLGGAMNPKAAARHLFRDIFRFEEADVTRIEKSGLTDADRKRINYMGQRMAQGTSSVGALPNWGPFSSSPNWRTLALYKKMIHQATRNVLNTVGGGLAKGDFGPLIRRILTGIGVGYVMENTIRRLFYGRRDKARNDSFMSKMWYYLVKGEGLAMLSNFVDADRYGTIADEMGGAVVGNAKKLFEEIHNWAFGKQTGWQTVDDVLSTIAAKTFAEQVMRRNRADYLDVRDAYYRKAKKVGWEPDERGNHELTERSPYWRSIREALWLKPKDADMGGESIEAAVQYLMDEALVNRSEAESRVRTILRGTSPIPKSKQAAYFQMLSVSERRLALQALRDWEKRVARTWAAYAKARDERFDEMTKGATK